MMERRTPKEELSKALEGARDTNRFYGIQIPSARWAKKRHQLRTFKSKSTIYRVFPIQRAAFDYANRMNQDPSDLDQYFVFAGETGEARHYQTQLIWRLT